MGLRTVRIVHFSQLVKIKLNRVNPHCTVEYYNLFTNYYSVVKILNQQMAVFWLNERLFLYQFKYTGFWILQKRLVKVVDQLGDMRLNMVFIFLIMYIFYGSKISQERVKITTLSEIIVWRLSLCGVDILTFW